MQIHYSKHCKFVNGFYNITINECFFVFRCIINIKKKTEKENDEKIAVVSSAEALEHLHWDYRFVARTIATMHEEDFVDESTGEVVSVQIKDNILFERGYELSSDDISQLLFHFQTGDIKEIHLSNQQRFAQVTGRGMTLWVVKANGVKNVKIMLDFRRFSMIFDLSQSSGNVSKWNSFVQSAQKIKSNKAVIDFFIKKWYNIIYRNKFTKEKIK